MLDIIGRNCYFEQFLIESFIVFNKSIDEQFLTCLEYKNQADISLKDKMGRIP